MEVAEKTTVRPTSRGMQMLDRIDYRLANTAAEREEIYRLRYRAYLNEGAISPNPQGLTTDRFDALPNSWIFGVYLDGELASSLRISIGSTDYPQVPSLDVFPDLLKPEIEAGKMLVDPTRFVADPDRAKRCPELPYMTLRLAYVACSYFGADLGLATVRAEHQAFYRRVFMHEPRSGPRDYPGLIKPICLMAVEFAEKREQVYARYPFMRSSHFEQRMLFGDRDAGMPRRDCPPIVPAA